VRNLLIFLLVLGAIWWVRRAVTRSRAARRDDKRQRAAETLPERILACAHCGVHVPEAEGVRDGEAFYCCEAHRRLGDAGKGR